jgi:hypothetical protein
MLLSPSAFCYACFAFGEAKQAFVASQEAQQASLASHGGKTSKAGRRLLGRATPDHAKKLQFLLRSPCCAWLAEQKKQGRDA